MKKLRDNLNTWALLSPWVITLLVFWVYPLCYAAYISLTNYSTLTSKAVFIGMDNYTAIFKDPLFWKSLLNTVIFTGGTVPVTTGLALFIATILNNKVIKFKNFFRATYFLPSVTSLIVISLIFTNLYTKDGYINFILSSFNLPFPEKGWLQEPSTAMFSIMLMDIWGAVGYYTVLFLAGMQTISKDYYDAARLDGASDWQQFKKITFPLINSTLLFIIVINTIKSFQIFIEIYVMTKGGPLNETTTLVYMIFINAFEKADMMGYASALAFVVFIILLLFSFLQMKLIKTKI